MSLPRIRKDGMIIRRLTSVETTGLVRVLLEAWEREHCKIHSKLTEFEHFTFIGISHDFVRVGRVENSDEKAVLRIF